MNEERSHGILSRMEVNWNHFPVLVSAICWLYNFPANGKLCHVLLHTQVLNVNLNLVEHTHVWKVSFLLFQKPLGDCVVFLMSTSWPTYLELWNGNGYLSGFFATDSTDYFTPKWKWEARMKRKKEEWMIEKGKGMRDNHNNNIASDVTSGYRLHELLWVFLESKCLTFCVLQDNWFCWLVTVLDEFFFVILF